MTADLTSRIVQRDTRFVEQVNPGTAIDLNTGRPIMCLGFVDDRGQEVDISFSWDVGRSLHERMGLVLDVHALAETRRNGD